MTCMYLVVIIVKIMNVDIVQVYNPAHQSCMLLDQCMPYATRLLARRDVGNVGDTDATPYMSCVQLRDEDLAGEKRV